MSKTIETRDISRYFGEIVAVDKVNLSINSGEIFGLLGPNAAGKSTIIRLLAGILVFLDIHIDLHRIFCTLLPAVGLGGKAYGGQ